MADSSDSIRPRPCVAASPAPIARADAEPRAQRLADLMHRSGPDAGPAEAALAVDGSISQPQQYSSREHREPSRYTAGSALQLMAVIPFVI